MAKEVRGHDEAPSAITDHAFVPRAQWWSLCKICGLAQAAHSSTTIDAHEEMRKDHERQREWREVESQRVHSGGRARIGYVSDDDMEDE